MTVDRAAIARGNRNVPGKACFGILGFIYAIVMYQLPASIAASLITETGNFVLIKASIVVQFAVGLSFSAIAYGTAWDRSFKVGMLACYGLVVGLVFFTGAYSILTII